MIRRLLSLTFDVLDILWHRCPLGLDTHLLFVARSNLLLRRIRKYIEVIDSVVFQLLKLRVFALLYLQRLFQEVREPLLHYHRLFVGFLKLLLLSLNFLDSLRVVLLQTLNFISEVDLP